MATKTAEQKAADVPVKQNAAKQRTGETVTVALKHPSGLVLRVYEMQDDYEDVMGGGQRKTKKAFPIGEPVRLNGTGVGKGFIPTWRVVGGYALTPGVPKDMWELWCEQNADAPLLKNGLICAFKSIEGADAMAREREGTRSGLEPITPDTDPRIPRNRGARIETGDEQKKSVEGLSQRMGAIEDMMARQPAA